MLNRTKTELSHGTAWVHRLRQGGIGAVIVLLALCAVFTRAHAQDINQSPDGLWQVADDAVPVTAAAMDAAAPTAYRLVATDAAALQQTLLRAPQEDDLTTASALELSLPLADGTFQRFRIAEYQSMKPQLANALPGVKTYLGWGVDNPAATARLSWMTDGFHGMILADGGIQYVDAVDADRGLYRAYDSRALPRTPWAEQLLQEETHAVDGVAAASVNIANIGEIRHTYRLAIAASGEFTQFYGSKQAAKEGIVNIVNQLNALYERELSIRFVLVDNDAIVFTNAGTDPFSQPVDFTAIGRMLDENQTLLDQTIGAGNYDVGHVFGIGSGGLGGTEPCLDGRKAQGSSNVSNPKSPTFVTGMFAHELAHQFSAGHTFNASCGGNRSSTAAYEPASGSTIMSYGGVCQGQNIVSEADAYFNVFSIQEITALVTDPARGGSCGTHTPVANAAPQVNAGADATIPAQTPFKLVGSATDPNGDSLTYTWEQFNNGAAWSDSTVLPNTDLGSNPIFRSFPPGPSATRYLPAINNGEAAKGESLPTTTRTMTFRLTARDGKGGVGSDDVNVNVIGGAGPFVVTAPTAGSFWTPNSQQTVTWSVANTNQAPVSCANVNILASSDGGNNFVPLVQNTPNDGAQVVTAPASGVNTLIMVECAAADKIFYAISPQPGVRVCTAILQDNHEDGAGGWTVGGPANPSAGFYKPWVLATNGGFSGSNYWFVDNNRNGQFTTLESQEVTASSDAVSLSFVHKYRFYALTSQIGKVQLKVNGGAWQDLAGYSDQQPDYRETQLDLTGKVKSGDTIQVRFRRENNSNSFMVLDGPDGWSIDDVLICASSIDQTPTEPNPVVPDTGDRTWTGAASANWGDAANWAPQAVPTAQNNAVIPTGLARYPAINGNFAVKGMVIAGGATVDMTGGDLTVHGNWGQTNATSDGQPIQVCRAFGASEAQISEEKLLDPNPVVDILSIDKGTPIADLDLFLDFSHTWVGDVVATLRHETTGTEVVVFDPSNDNCSGDNAALTLDDEASSAVADACTAGNPAYPGNRYKPNNALSAFDGQLSAGQWKLTLTDIYPTVDTGRLNRWCVNITPVNAGGIFNGTGGTVIFAGAQLQQVRTGATSVFNNVRIGDGTTAQQVKLTNGIDVNGALTILGNAVLDGGGAIIHLAGTWQQPTSASFLPGTSSVIFDGGAQSVSLGAPGTLQPVNFNIINVNQGSTVDFGYSWPLAAQQMINNGTMRQTKDVPANANNQFFSSGGYGGVTMRALGGAPGTTVISVSRQTTGCTAKAGETVQRCFDINPQNKANLNAEMTFFYGESEQSGNSCTFMNAYQNDLSGANLPELTVGNRSCTGPLRAIAITGVNNFTTTAFTLGSDVGGDNKRADDPPVAVEDQVVLIAGQAEYVIDVLFNDFDPEGLPVTLDFVGSAEHGVTDVNRTSIVYAPVAGFVGDDLFSYEISDVGSQTATATVKITILPPEETINQLFLPLLTR